MPRGAPDYGIYERPAIAKQSFWKDDFEAPVLRWTPASSAGSPNPVLSTVDQWSGIQSVYFATVAAAPEHSAIFRRFPLSKLGKVGVEFIISLNSRTPGYFRAYFTIEDGTNISRAELRLDMQAATASIITPAGIIPVATFCFPAWPNRTWIPVKLVVDTNTDIYDRLFIGPQSISLSTQALVAIGPTTDNFISLDLRLVGDAVLAMNAYVDDFVMSQNEP